MLVTCQECSRTYVLDEALLPPAGAQVQCTRCGHVFTARPPLRSAAGPRAVARTVQALFDSLLADLRELRKAEAARDAAGDDEPTQRHHPPVSQEEIRARAAKLTEIRQVRQVPGESRRRWFTSDDLDLIVWSDGEAPPWGFQLCYDKRKRAERAVTWREGSGFAHSVVNDGAKGPLEAKGAPLLEPDERFDANRVAALFDAASDLVPDDLRRFVAGKLREHPRYGEGVPAPNLRPGKA